MAVRLFRVGSVWHYRFQVDGERRQRSTRQINRARAEHIAQQAYREARLWHRKSPAMPTLSELVTQWLSAHAQTVSASHLNNIERFGRLHLGPLGSVSIAKLTTSMVEDARNHHLQSHAPITANQWARNIRLVCHWAVHRGIIPAVPFKIRLLKVQRTPRATLPVDLTSAWLDAIDTLAAPPIRTAVRLMIGMGLRESEAATARWEWLDTVRQTYTPGQTKGREAEPIPMPAWLIDHLRPLRKPAGLMVANKHGRPFSRGFTRRGIDAANKAVGIGKITPHRLRGTLATLLSEHGAPVQSIQKVMRHKNALTTIGYLEADMHRVALAQRSIAELCGFQQ